MIFNNSTGSDQKFYEEATDNSQQSAYFSDCSVAWFAWCMGKMQVLDIVQCPNVRPSNIG